MARDQGQPTPIVRDRPTDIGLPEYIEDDQGVLIFFVKV